MRALLLAVLILFAAPTLAADVGITLSWSAPTTGGPVDSYAVTCTDAAGTQVLATTTTTLSAAGSATGVSEGQGSCALTAIGPGGQSAPVIASWSISVELPPGPPSNFQITLDCMVVDGVVVCEQV